MSHDCEPQQGLIVGDAAAAFSTIFNLSGGSSYSYWYSAAAAAAARRVTRAPPISAAPAVATFGRIVNAKSGVGANDNQAFVEFTDVNQAISMVSYFASSSEF